MKWEPLENFELQHGGRAEVEPEAEAGRPARRLWQSIRLKQASACPRMMAAKVAKEKKRLN